MIVRQRVYVAHDSTSGLFTCPLCGRRAPVEIVALGSSAISGAAAAAATAGDALETLELVPCPACDRRPLKPALLVFATYFAAALLVGLALVGIVVIQGLSGLLSEEGALLIAAGALLGGAAVIAALGTLLRVRRARRSIAFGDLLPEGSDEPSADA